MVKIQQVIRPNGTRVFPVYLTLKIVEETGFKKGDVVEWTCITKGVAELRRVDDKEC